MTALVNLERCINQVFRPSDYAAQPRPWKGDCRTCTYHPLENKECCAYVGIKVQYVLSDEEQPQ